VPPLRLNPPPPPFEDISPGPDCLVVPPSVSVPVYFKSAVVRLVEDAIPGQSPPTQALRRESGRRIIVIIIIIIIIVVIISLLPVPVYFKSAVVRLVEDAIPGQSPPTQALRRESGRIIIIIIIIIVIVVVVVVIIIIIIIIIIVIISLLPVPVYFKSAVVRLVEDAIPGQSPPTQALRRESGRRIIVIIIIIVVVVIFIIIIIIIIIIIMSMLPVPVYFSRR
jgi:hypothetical protein